MGREIGDAGTFTPQSWDLVSNATPIRPLTGVIHSTAYNEGDYWDDGDWCIWVKPDSAYSPLLRNSDGDQSEGLDGDTDHNSNGRMELEIHNPGVRGLNPSNLIGVGSWVQALGWWVEDFGHSAWSPKSELHPIVRLIEGRLDGTFFRVLQAIDCSDRFESETHSTWQQYEVPMGLAPADVNLQQPIAGPIQCDVLTETAKVDRTYLFPLVSPAQSLALWQAGRTRAVADQHHGSVRLAIAVHRAAGIWPFYYGEFERSLAGQLSLKVAKNISVVPGGKRLTFTVTAQFTAPAGQTLAYTDWRYEQGSGGAAATSVPEGTPPTSVNTLSYDLYYGTGKPIPGTGTYASLSNDTWSLSVIAGTRARNWAPGLRTNATQTDYLNAETRLFLEGTAVLKIQSSFVTIRADAQSQPLSATGAAGLTAVQAATPAINKFLVKMTPHLNQDASETSRAWQVKLIADTDGQPPPVPTVITIAANSNGTVPLGAGVELTPVDTVTLRVDFKWLVTNVQAGFVISGGNYSRVVVTAVLSTDLQEHPDASTEELHPQPAVYEMGVAKFFENIERYAVAVRELQRKGLPVLPGPWPAPLLASWPPASWHPGTPLKFLQRHVPVTQRPVLDAARKIIDGRRLTAAEVTLALGGAKRGAQLAPLKIVLAKPKALDHLGLFAAIGRGQILLPNLAFAPTTAALTAESKATLDEWRNALSANPELRITILAETSSAPTESDNLVLSQRRAREIAKAVLPAGADKDRVIAVGTGRMQRRVAAAPGDRIEIRVS